MRGGVERGRDVIIFPFSTAIKESQVKKFTELSIVKKKRKEKTKGFKKGTRSGQEDAYDKLAIEDPHVLEVKIPDYPYYSMRPPHRT